MEHNLAEMSSRLSDLVGGYDHLRVGDVFQLDPYELQQIFDLLDWLYDEIDRRLSPEAIAEAVRRTLAEREYNGIEGVAPARIPGRYFTRDTTRRPYASTGY